MAVFWSYFRDFVGAQKIEDLSESKNFFAEVFQITSRFVLAGKKFGVRCTLSARAGVAIDAINYTTKHMTKIKANFSYGGQINFNEPVLKQGTPE